MSNQNRKYTSLQEIEDAYLEPSGETQPAKKNIIILVKNDHIEDKPNVYTKNIVYKEIF